MRISRRSALSLFACALVSSRRSASPAIRVGRSGGSSITCTPRTIALPGQAPKQVDNPLARALEKAHPGTRITLAPGDYAPFTIGQRSNSRHNAKTSGGSNGAPVVIEGYGKARIVGRQGDTIGIDQAHRVGHIHFHGLTIIAAERAGVMFYRQPAGRTHNGFYFVDCHVFGHFNHEENKGRKAKWGIWGHSLVDFRFVGRNGRARVEGIRDEHAFYLQNHQGPILIENVRGRRLGRTFCQFTARAKEGPPGKGTITVRNCHVQDVGIGRGDGFKGGSAFTFAGRLTGAILLEGNKYDAGFAPSLHHLTTEGVPYGTGALAAWQGGEKIPNGVLTLRDNDFRFADGCGDRPVVAIGGCRDVRIVGANRFLSGGSQPALALNPVDDLGRPLGPPNGEVRLKSTTRLRGEVTIGGRRATPAQLADLAR